MDDFCGSTFWDVDVSWNTNVPDLTRCFQSTVLVWVPCAFLWLVTPVEAYFIHRHRGPKLPWTLLNITKLVISILLVALELAEMSFQVKLYMQGMGVFPSDYYSPFVRLVSFLLVLCIIVTERLKGVRTSAVLFGFWLLMAISGLITYRSMLLRAFNENFHYGLLGNEMNFGIFMLYYPLVMMELVMECFSDTPTPDKQLDKKPCPEDSASVLSTLTFWWFQGMAVLGYKKALAVEDMWTLSRLNQTENIVREFDKHWKPVVEAAARADTHLVPNGVEKNLRKQEADSDPTSASIILPLLKTFGWQALFAAILKLLASLMVFVSPTVLDWLITYIGSDEPLWKGFFYAGIMFFSSLVESMLNNQQEFMVWRLAMRIRSCVISAIYRKSIKLSNTARRRFTTGEIVTLMSVDTQRIMEYIQVINWGWSAPLQIGVAIFMLWGQLGMSTLAGLAVMILLIPLNGIITVRLKSLQVQLMKEKDGRTKLMNEVLSGIKVLKLYAWEGSFQKQLMNFRNREIGQLLYIAYYSCFIMFFFTIAPFLVSLASFATYVLSKPTNILDPNKAFVSLSLFNIMRVPMNFLPMLVTYGAMFVVSLRRVNRFLQCEELDPNATSRNDNESDALIMENGTFAWNQGDEPILKNISFRVKPSKLVAVVGSVGSGKSSLLSAALGDMEKIRGRVNIKGSIAYAPQQAWIQNEALRSNILFMSPYRRSLYNRVLEACALKADLEILAGGDMTEIGEKGINLSGGQKQRVGLARAVYANCDVYLLDDPLSAVDTHVGKHIFEQVIGPNGLLKDKTRILVTHKLSVLPKVDTIIVMKDGTISEVGSYTDLLARKGDFAEFLVQHFTQESEDPDENAPEEMSIIEDLVAVVGPRPELERRMSMLSGAESDSQVGEGDPWRRRTSRSPSVSSVSTLRQRSKSRGEAEGSSKSRRHKLPSRSKLVETETAEVGSVKWSVYLNYLKSVGYCGVFWSIFSFMASYCFNVGSSIWLSLWSNDALDPSRATNPDVRNLRLGVYGALGFGETVFVFMSSLVLNITTLRGSQLLHDNMLVHILKAPMSFFDTTPVGRILNRFSKDVDTTDTTIRFNIRMLLLNAFRTLATFLIICLETPIFLAALVPISILYYILQKYYLASSRQLKRLESVTRSPIYTHFSETVSGASVIRAFGARDTFVKESDQRVDLNCSTFYPSMAANRWLAVRLEFLGYCIVFLAATFAVLSRGSLSPGTAGLSVSYALTVTMTLNMLVRSCADVEVNIVSVERCLEYTCTPVEAPWHIDDTKPNSMWPPEGRVKFNNYATRYRDGLELVLKDVTCEFKAREKVGIVGRTGAGKSSLTLALFRIIEAATGKIVIDNVEISKIGLQDLRSRLTVIPQDPVLFAGTVRFNLDPFDSYSDNELWKALELAHLREFIKSQDGGLQYQVSEGGENLSVGQRQLVCLARALLRKTKVLVLDEATAAVDVETDELIQATIREEFSDCTVITIAHRLNTVTDYDRILVMDDGRVAEFDSPKVLLQNPHSIFYSMAKDSGLL